MKFADLLRAHWPHYVAQAVGPIPADHWRAVEAVLSCRTPRRGGHLYRCPDCARVHYQFHSCNHRSCPQCGAGDRQRWAAVQEARLLPVPYYLLTCTVPAELRAACRRAPRVLYDQLLRQSVQALRDLCRNPKYLGGATGCTAVLQTWTRRMLFHPHVHLLLPAVALSADGCQLHHPRHEEFLVPVLALAAHLRHLFRQALASAHPEIYEHLAPAVWQKAWVVHCQPVGRGRAALRYLARYVGKAAFDESRLAGWDAQGRVLLRYHDSADDRWKTEALPPVELIGRWLLHVLPKGFVGLRHFGFLSPAAGRALRRVRFLLGRGPVRRPARAPWIALCPCCQKPLVQVRRLQPVRGPPLSRSILQRAA